MIRNRPIVLCLVFASLVWLGHAGETPRPKTGYGKVELLRDTWGIPHVFAETDAGALYGLGYATADERGFQMTYSLRIIQGRLSEVVGVRRRGNRNETSLDHDRQMRTFGWAQAAERTASNVDSETKQLLEAYCAGVNDSFSAQKATGRLHPLFQRFGIELERWTPADCLLSWWHLAQFFATDGTRELIVWRNREHPRPGQPPPPQLEGRWLDDAAAVVQRSDVSQEWLDGVERFAKEHGFIKPAGGASEGPKFSHAWVVSGSRTTTRAAVLVSDPQTPVRNPSLWMEFHVSGKTFNVRGIGVPGSPGLLIGFSRDVAWGLTALGGDQADLFRLQTDAQHPDQYRWDEHWREMRTRTEQIRVKGTPSIPFTIRETHLGPVVSEFCFRQPGDPEVALKRVPVCETNRDTIQGVFAMMRARNSKDFAAAAANWEFPSANCVYGDRMGNIGYAALGAVPVRSTLAADSNGNEASPGNGNACDWQGFVPAQWLPRVQNPGSGYLLSANHRPVASFYRIPLGISTGSMGDTMRSWRLRERLASHQGLFTPEDVLEIHNDSVNPARRDIVRLAVQLKENQPEALSAQTKDALRVLEPWLKGGASSDLSNPGAELATKISTFFRFVATPLARVYGGGESGLARFLKDATSRIDNSPKTKLNEEEARWVDSIVANAWAERDGNSAETGRMSAGRNASPRVRLGWFDSLDGFGSLDSANDVAQPGITCLDGQTIHSQAAQSYTQFVTLQDPDASQSICPIGHSDRLDSPYRSSTVSLWAKAMLHPAPLSRAAVERITAERKLLSN